MLKNGKSSKADLIAENEGTIDLKSKKSVGMLADKSVANNKNEINITNEESNRNVWNKRLRSD